MAATAGSRACCVVDELPWSRGAYTGPQLRGPPQTAVLRRCHVTLLTLAPQQLQQRRQRCGTSVETERGTIGTSVPHVPRLNRINLRSCKSYCCTVLFSLFNTVPNIVSLVRSGFLPVSVCFFQNSDLRNENSELSSDQKSRESPWWKSNERVTGMHWIRVQHANSE